MRIWMLSWNLPKLLSGLCVHVALLLGSVCVAFSDRTPEQLAALMNCSKHERHARNYDYMEGGDVRIRQLFSRTQWFLTIDDDGSINGTQDPTNCYSKNPQSLLTLFTIECSLLHMLYIYLCKYKYIYQMIGLRPALVVRFSFKRHLTVFGPR